ncbi:MAG TPA: hypothetical protein VFC73_00050 [Syntrophomonadaceae bacterium]|nr:hypothetical protein [Syntrophomonadaceae bacterium]
MLTPIIKVLAIILTLSSIVLVIYAIATSVYTSLLFWAIYIAVVGIDLLLIRYLQKQE